MAAAFFLLKYISIFRVSPAVLNMIGFLLWQFTNYIRKVANQMYFS
jgi:hypothetical protein